jgi:quercetin dioxygenase-like cupin family protein
MDQDTTAPSQQKPVTSGSATRPARTLRRPVLIDLGGEAASLLDEKQPESRDRNSRTVATTDRVRITITALEAGAELGSEESDDTLVVQALRGRLVLSVDGMDVDLREGQLATVEEPAGWRLRATTDSVLMLTVALGRRTTG